nr:MAG TPA: hypothetical protein [Crassvirales sp.]
MTNQFNSIYFLTHLALCLMFFVTLFTNKLGNILHWSDI